MAQTIAILGGTGGTGREIIKQLLQKDGIVLRLYVRSRTKLIGLFPAIDTDTRVTVVEGAITDVHTIAECLRGAQTIICTIGQNENRPGAHAIQDAAQSIVSALGLIRGQTQEWHRPRVLQLSAAPWNDRFRAQMPKVGHWLLTTAFWWTYVDLLKGHDIYHGASDLLKLTLIQPPGFVDDKPSGYVISTEVSGTTVTYPDLAAGFVEIATNEQYSELSAVGLFSKKGDEVLRHVPTLILRFMIGLVSGYVPYYWTVHDAIYG